MIYKIFNKKHINLFAISLFFLCQTSFSQSPDWMSEYEIKALEEMNLIYTKSNKFDEITGHKPFKNNQTWLEYEYNQLQSTDNRFIAFININGISRIHKKIGLLSISNLGILSPKEKEHYKSGEIYIDFMKRGILNYKGEEEAANWEKHINFYSKKETENKFNADKAISYSIKLQPKDYHQGKYNNLWVLYLQKKYKRFKTPKEFKEYKKLKFKEIDSIWTLEEKETIAYKDFIESWEKALSGSGELFIHPTGFVMIYCFYEDMPKRKLAKYKAKVEDIFRYND